MKYKTVIRLRNTAAVFLAVFLFLFAVVGFFLVACFTVDLDARVLPSYDRVDLSAILSRPAENWTEEELDTVCYQTGVFDREWLKRQPAETLLDFQEALFFRGEVVHDDVAWTTPHDMLIDPESGEIYFAPVVGLEPGDIILTSTCHTYGWRNGHAALIVPGNRILQSFTLGEDSDAILRSSSNGVQWFQSASNFMVLRLKGADAETRYDLAEHALHELSGIPYSLIVGIFMPKDQGTAPKGTHCSHLVWQAYKNAGYDIDYDGGPVCTTRDIANSPYLEVIQYYGFDPTKGW